MPAQQLVIWVAYPWPYIFNLNCGLGVCLQTVVDEGVEWNEARSMWVACPTVNDKVHFPVKFKAESVEIESSFKRSKV